MIYLYGLVDPATRDPSYGLEGLVGVTGPVLCASFKAGHLLYGAHDASPILAKRRFLLAHTRVLEVVSEKTTVLPMRFGMLAEDVTEVAELVTQQADAIEVQFARLNGMVEYGVRLSFPSKPALAHELGRHPVLVAERDRLARGSGHFERAEFGEKLGAALERHRTDLQHNIVAALRRRGIDLVLRAPESEYQVLNAYVLLRAEEEAAFPNLVAELAAALDFAPGADPQIELVGPAPLYNFVQLNLAATPREVA